MTPTVFKAYTSTGVIVLMAASMTAARLTINELFPDDEVRMIVHDNDWSDQ